MPCLILYSFNFRQSLNHKSFTLHIPIPLYTWRLLSWPTSPLSIYYFECGSRSFSNLAHDILMLWFCRYNKARRLFSRVQREVWLRKSLPLTFSERVNLFFDRSTASSPPPAKEDIFPLFICNLKSNHQRSHLIYTLFLFRHVVETSMCNLAHINSDSQHVDNGIQCVLHYRPPSVRRTGSWKEVIDLLRIFSLCACLSPNRLNEEFVWRSK